MHDESITVLVPLTQGAFAIIDAEDAPAVLRYKWHLSTKGYAIRARHKAEGVGPEKVFLHRFVLGVESGVLVDHISGVKLDNRKANLRPATTSQNCANAGPHRDNSTGFRGVTVAPYGAGWTAAIMVGRKSKYLGRFPTPELAARAYDAAAITWFGEFARCNFPTE
jgi:hypothetical protein